MPNIRLTPITTIFYLKLSLYMPYFARYCIVTEIQDDGCRPFCWKISVDKDQKQLPTLFDLLHGPYSEWYSEYTFYFQQKTTVLYGNTCGIYFLYSWQLTQNDVKSRFKVNGARSGYKILSKFGQLWLWQNFCQSDVFNLSLFQRSTFQETAISSDKK